MNLTQRITQTLKDAHQRGKENLQNQIEETRKQVKETPSQFGLYLYAGPPVFVPYIEGFCEPVLNRLKSYRKTSK